MEVSVAVSCSLRAAPVGSGRDGLYEIPIKVGSQHHSWQYLCPLLYVDGAFSCAAQ